MRADGLGVRRWWGGGVFHGISWYFWSACCRHMRVCFVGVESEGIVPAMVSEALMSPRESSFFSLAGTVGASSTSGAGLSDGDRPGHGEDLVGCRNQQGLRDVVGSPLPGKMKPFASP